MLVGRLFWRVEQGRKFAGDILIIYKTVNEILRKIKPGERFV